MEISKYDKKFEYGKILTEGDLNDMVDAINLSIDGVNNVDAKSETAIKEATTAKNAVKTLEGLANSTEAMETLAGQVVQIEENKNDISEIQRTDTPFASNATFFRNTGGAGLAKDEAYQMFKGFFLNKEDNADNWYIRGVDSKTISIANEAKTILLSFPFYNPNGLNYITLADGDYAGSILIVDMSYRKTTNYGNRNYPEGAFDTEQIRYGNAVVNAYRMKDLKDVPQDIEYLKTVKNPLPMLTQRGGLILEGNVSGGSSTSSVDTYDLTDMEGQIVAVKLTTPNGGSGQQICAYNILGEADELLLEKVVGRNSTKIDDKVEVLSGYKKIQICYSKSLTPECYNKLLTNPSDILKKMDKEEYAKHIEDYKDLSDEVRFRTDTTIESITNNAILTASGKAGSSGHQIFSFDVATATKARIKVEVGYIGADKIAYAILDIYGNRIYQSPTISNNTVYQYEIEIMEGADKLLVTSQKTTPSIVEVLYRENLQEAVKEIKDYLTPLPTSVTFIGDSTGGGINKPFLINYFKGNGMKFYQENRGGEQTNAMGAYQGSMPILISEALTIPASGSVEFTPVSSLMKPNGLMANYQTFGQFDSIHDRIGINPVTIKGVKGTISSSNTIDVRGVVFYNAGGYQVGTFRPSQYAQTHELSFSTPPVGIKVCINAFSQDDVNQSTCHVTINDTIIDLIPHINKAGYYLNSSGQEVAQEGYYVSELIPLDVSEPKTIYLDGLAVGMKLMFTRLEDGEEQYVEQFYPVYSENYKLFKDSVNLFYINNFLKTGRELSEDWAYQVKILTDYAKDKKFIFANTHYMFSGNTDEEILKIENNLRALFGNKYFSGYTYLKDAGINDGLRCGLFTAEQISGLDWKQVFLTNSIDSGTPNTNYDVHQNRYASYLIARKFIEIGIMLGYWDEFDYSYETLGAE